MKKCPYCKIDVGGDLLKCPLCQSKLQGEAEKPFFPRRDTLQFRSFLYKLQLFIVWVVVIVALCLDFLVAVRIPDMPNFHWSLVLAMWLIVFEYGIIRQFRPGMGPARKVTMMVLLILAMLTITAYFFGFLQITFDLIIPIVLAGTVIAGFVLAMVDKNGNALVYLLSDLLLGVLPCLILLIIHKEMPIAWVICMTVSVILLVGAIVFKGKSVAAELHRRFNV